MPLKKKTTGSSKPKRVQKEMIRSTQMDVPVETIINGCVITKDNRLVKIIEVTPVQLFNRSVEEQNSLFARFSQVLKIMPRRFQFTTMSLSSDLTQQINDTKERIKTETSEPCKRLGENYIDVLDTEQKTGIQRRFFVSFESEDDIDFLKGGKEVNEAIQKLNMTAATITDRFARLGNIQPKKPHLTEKYNKDNVIPAEILYKALNRDYGNFENKLDSVLMRYFEKFHSPNFVLKPAQYISPDKMVFNDKRYIKVNNTYYTFLYITPNGGYVSYVYGGWTGQYVFAGKGIDLNIYFERGNRDVEMSRLRRSVAHTSLALNENDTNSEAYDNSSELLQAASYLKEGIRNREDFYNMSIMVTISGSTIEEVERKADAVTIAAHQNDMTLKPYLFQMKDAFISSLPLGRLSTDLFKKSKNNVLTSGVASTYPFISTDLFDPNGIWLGKNTATGSMIVLDLFDQDKYRNANCFGCGMTGTGKTYTLETMALRMRVQQIQVFIIAPEKQHEFKRICEAIGGEFIEIAPGSNTRINIMEIRKEDKLTAEDMANIDGATANESRLAEKIDEVVQFIKVHYPISKDAPHESFLLTEAVTKTYERFGFTDNNDSLFDPNDPTHTNYRPMPILSDLVETLEGMGDEAHGLALAVRNLCVGPNARVFNGPTNVDVNNKFTVFGIEKIKGPLGIHLVMDFIWSKTKENRLQKKAIFIDEVWALALNPSSANYLMEIAKLIRAYRGAMILFTQQMTDLLQAQAEDGVSLGDKILNACQSHVLLGMSRNDAETTQRILGLSDEDTRELIDAERGDALVVANNESTKFHVYASPMEHELITTKASDLEKIAAARKKEKELGMVQHLQEESDEPDEDDEDMFEIEDYEADDESTYYDDAPAEQNENQAYPQPDPAYNMPTVAPKTPLIFGADDFEEDDDLLVESGDTEPMSYQNDIEYDNDDDDEEMVLGFDDVQLKPSTISKPMHETSKYNSTQREKNTPIRIKSNGYEELMSLFEDNTKGEDN